MKKLTLIAFIAGIVASSSALATENNVDAAGVFKTNAGMETIGVGTRPRPPRPPQLVNETILEVGTRPGRPRPPFYSDSATNSLNEGV